MVFTIGSKKATKFFQAIRIIPHFRVAVAATTGRQQKAPACFIRLRNDGRLYGDEIF